MTVKTLLGIFLISIFIVSCKKEKAPEPEPEPEALAPFQNSPYSVSNATKYDGVFNLYKFTFFAVANHYDYKISFNDTPSANYYAGNIIPVGSVRLNNKNINADTAFHDYRAFDVAIGGYGTETWQIQGANGIPSFNYTSSTDPNCTNFNALPDSFNISTGFTFTVNVINTDTSANHSTALTDNAGHFSQSKPLHSGTNVITFTNADLINLNPTLNGTLSFYLANTEVLNFYGKNFKFIKTRYWEKFIKIKP